MALFIIILICLLIICFILTNLHENFLISNDNSYFKPLKNIFLGDNYYNYLLNSPKIIVNDESLKTITIDAFLYSKPTAQKIICSSYTNRADCWEDNTNNCQWVYKIDNGSYCDVGQKWL